MTPLTPANQIDKVMKSVKSYRHKLLGAVHIVKKKHNMNDDTYRAFLERVVGKTSAKDLTDKQLKLVLAQLSAYTGKASDALDRGCDFANAKPPYTPRYTQNKDDARIVNITHQRWGARGASSRDDGDSSSERMSQSPSHINAPVRRKVRALWVSGYHLGLIENENDAAMRAFIKRQLRIDHENWMNPQIADKVIEALKAWLVREASVNWNGGITVMKIDGTTGIKKYSERHNIINAQLKKLETMGKIKDAIFADEYCCVMLAIQKMGIAKIPPEQQDELIRKLGWMIRNEMSNDKN